MPDDEKRKAPTPDEWDCIERRIDLVPEPPKRYRKVKAGQWVQPRMNGYYMKCCDCGLVHRLNFRIVGVRTKRVQMQGFRIAKGPKRQGN